MEHFLKNYIVKKETDEKPITHTSMKGGKWSIPENKMHKFYKLANKCIVNGPENNLLVEKKFVYLCISRAPSLKPTTSNVLLT